MKWAATISAYKIFLKCEIKRKKGSIEFKHVKHEHKEQKYGPKEGY
jgi:hypothetical protein